MIKRLFSVLLALLLLFSVAAAAQAIDLKQMSDEELIALQEAISKELADRHAVSVGEDILQPDETGPAGTVSGWQDAYYQYLIGDGFWSRTGTDSIGWTYCTDPFGLTYVLDAEDSDHNIFPVRFALYDWDQDGVPELFGYDGTSGRSGSFYAFSFRNNQMVYLGEAGNGWYNLAAYRDADYNVLFSQVIDGPYTDVQYAFLTDEGQLSKKTLFVTNDHYMGEDEPYQIEMVDGPHDQFLYEIFCAHYEPDLLTGRLQFVQTDANMNEQWWNDFIGNYNNTYTGGTGEESSPHSAVYVISTKETRIRESADKSSTLVKTIGANVEVAVLQTSTGADNQVWYQVRLPDGTVGFARSDFFKKSDKPVSN